MSVVDEYLAEVEAHRPAGPEVPEPWPAGDALVLEHDTAVELGSPAVGSLAGVLWADPQQTWHRQPGGRIQIVGPDLDRLAGRRDVPFGRIVEVAASSSAADDGAAYRRHLALQDALAARQGALDGLLVRSRPSLQRIWCRVGRPAMDAGRSLRSYAAALVQAAQALGFVGAARVVLVVDRRQDLDRLRPAVEAAARAAAALVKRNEEDAPDCERCDYADVCATEETGT